jgi:hypothetical protein
MGEAASTMVANVDYELPYLRKQAARWGGWGGGGRCLRKQAARWGGGGATGEWAERGGAYEAGWRALRQWAPRPTRPCRRRRRPPPPPPPRYTQLIADAGRRSEEYVKSAASCAANYKQARVAFSGGAGIRGRRGACCGRSATARKRSCPHLTPLTVPPPPNPQECARLGIAGASVRAELQRLGATVPAAFQHLLGEQLRGGGLGEAVEYYGNWVAYAHPGSSGESVLPTLAEVRDGRTAPPAGGGGKAGGGGESGIAVEIDWDTALAGAGGGADAGGGAAEGAAAGGGGGSGGIDWDLDLSELAAAAAAGGGGGGEDEAGGSGGAAAGGEGPSISWDIELTEAAAEVADAAGAPSAGAEAADGADAGASGGEAVEAAAARLAADHEYRAALNDDLQVGGGATAGRRGNNANPTSSHPTCETGRPDSLLLPSPSPNLPPPRSCAPSCCSARPSSAAPARPAAAPTCSPRCCRRPSPPSTRAARGGCWRPLRARLPRSPRPISSSCSSSPAAGAT